MQFRVAGGNLAAAHRALGSRPSSCESVEGRSSCFTQQILDEVNLLRLASCVLGG